MVVSLQFKEDRCDSLLFTKRPVEREAISLAPRLQPGDREPELLMNRF